MIYDFQGTQTGNGIYDFGNTIIVGVIRTRGCVHIASILVNEMALASTLLTTIKLASKLTTTVSLASEAC